LHWADNAIHGFVVFRIDFFCMFLISMINSFCPGIHRSEWYVLVLLFQNLTARQLLRTVELKPLPEFLEVAFKMHRIPAKAPRNLYREALWYCRPRVE
jgi:hypothetical protein